METDTTTIVSTPKRTRVQEDDDEYEVLSKELDGMFEIRKHANGDIGIIASAEAQAKYKNNAEAINACDPEKVALVLASFFAYGSITAFQDQLNLIIGNENEKVASDTFEKALAKMGDLTGFAELRRSFSAEPPPPKEEEKKEEENTPLTPEEESSEEEEEEEEEEEDDDDTHTSKTEE
jgi:hypothetical protein